MQKRTAQPVGERGESADGRGYANPSLTAHGSGPLSPGPSPPEGGEGGLADAEIKAKAGLNSSPARGSRRRCGATAGPSQTVEGQVQGITTPEGQEDSPVPLHHPSGGPPPHSGEDMPPGAPPPPFGWSPSPCRGGIQTRPTRRPSVGLGPCDRLG